MNIHKKIEVYINSQPEVKRSELHELNQMILWMLPECRLWFFEGTDSEGKTVSNPNIGYGLHLIKYANETTKEFYKIGLSANTAGISVYIMGVKDKAYLALTYGKKIGKAKVTGYCIKFKSLKDIHIEVLKAAIQFGVEQE